MTTSLIDADSLLAVDVGTVNTRAALFDVVDGHYRFLASGVAPTTAGAPFHDVGEGMRLAIDNLQKITGRTLTGADARLIMPTTNEGTGVDTFAATISAGPALKIAVVGLLEDVSLESVRRLAHTVYCGALESISLNDRRKQEARIDAILRLRPNLVLVAGGTDGGASQSVLKLLEPVGLACYLIPENQRPELLFAGNQTLQEEIQGLLDQVVNLHFAPNIRPTLETEQLDASQSQVARLYGRVRAQQIQGVRELDELTGSRLLPTSAAFGRIIRYASEAHNLPKGVLGVDVGASATTLAAAFKEKLVLGAYPELGLAAGLGDHAPLSEVLRWLPMEISEGEVREYLVNRALYPAVVPVAADELAIDQVMARLALQAAVKKASPGFPAGAPGSGAGLLPWFEPIIATGSVLTQAPSLAQTMLMLLDGLQPTGATTFMLDQNHIVASLGAAAAINPVLAVQVLESNVLHLGTVISPVGNARPGTHILRLKVVYEENGHETSIDVKQGGLEVLPLPTGQTARVQFQALHRYDVGVGGPGRALRVRGGALGLIIDARGRPLRLPEDAGRRQELIRKWLWTLGG